ncbi:MAG TPA: HEAT repeat domain-containing protein [Planctomycetota bacterium]|nr:HEAT repeat domain-containing protein [Planctomycetota bacterium]
MQSLVLAIALLLAPDDAEAARDTLHKALTALDRPGVDRACAALVKTGDERAADFLLGAFRVGLVQSAALEKDRLRIVKDMKEAEGVKDKEGRFLKPGDSNKWKLLQYELDLLAAKIDILTGALPRVAAQLSRLTTTKPIAAVLTSAGEWYARACAAEALGRIGDADALAALLARAKVESEPGVRIAIADALASKVKGNDDVRASLLPWLESGTWGSKLAAAQALARTGDPKLIPNLIKLLQTPSGRMKYEINELLKKMTRADRHGDYTAWSAWWEKNDNEVLGGTYVPPAAEMAARQMAPVTMFYGIPVHSTRIVFIIDNSLSMKEAATWKPEIQEKDEKLDGERAIDIARYELKRIIKGLPDGALYDIIGMYGRLALLSDKWVTSGATTRAASIKFVQGLEVKVGTDVHGALMRALDFSGGTWNTPPREDSIDSVFILSDGIPSVGLMDRSQLSDRVLDAARFKRIAVTTIVIEGTKESQEMLRRIADGSGGAYVRR